MPAAPHHRLAGHSGRRGRAHVDPLNLTASVLLGPLETRSKVGVVAPICPNSSRSAIRASRWPARFRPVRADVNQSSSSRSITETTAVLGTRSTSTRWASCTAFQPLGSDPFTNRPIWT